MNGGSLNRPPETAAGTGEPLDHRHQESPFAGRWLDDDGINQIGTGAIAGKVKQQCDDPVRGVHHAFGLQRSRMWNQRRQWEGLLNAAQCR